MLVLEIFLTRKSAKRVLQGNKSSNRCNSLGMLMTLLSTKWLYKLCIIYKRKTKMLFLKAILRLDYRLYICNNKVFCLIHLYLSTFNNQPFCMDVCRKYNRDTTTFLLTIRTGWLGPINKNTI